MARKIIKYDHDGGKVWQNVLDKIAEYKITSPEYWTEYQLLGYWCNETKMKLNHIKGITPKYHPQIVKMRMIIKMLNESRFIPVNYDRLKIKHFLDWCIAIIDEKKYKISSLTFIITEENGECKWINNYRIDPTVFKRYVREEKDININDIDTEGFEV